MSIPSSAIAATTSGLIWSAGVAAGGADVHAALGVVVEQRRGHLAAPGVLDADEEDLGNVLGDRALDLAERAQPLAREAVHEQRHEVGRAARSPSASSDSAMKRSIVSGEKVPGELLAQRVESPLQVARG